VKRIQSRLETVESMEWQRRAGPVMGKTQLLLEGQYLAAVVGDTNTTTSTREIMAGVAVVGLPTKVEQAQEDL
jgi:hypothetical protein